MRYLCLNKCSYKTKVEERKIRPGPKLRRKDKHGQHRKIGIEEDEHRSN